MAHIFCNIGWMERYEGLNAGDKIVGGGAYVKKNGRGFEVCNFCREGNLHYGYVQVPGQQIDIERIGANPDDEFISNVIVIWTATRPTGGTAVIGWYKNANVYRNYQKYQRAPIAQRRNGIDGYWISASSNLARLLTVDERTCEIPRQVKGGMGQSNIWYADSSDSESIVAKVMRQVNGEQALVLAKNRDGKQDQERKVRIEQAAIHACREHLEGIGYVVTSVETDNVGWDLEAQSGKTVLRIEVKGLSGEVFCIELTPNEYLAFSNLSDSYRLAVVLNALDAPKLQICRYSREQNAWVVEGAGGKTLQVLVKQSASIKCI